MLEYDPEKRPRSEDLFKNFKVKFPNPTSSQMTSDDKDLPDKSNNSSSTNESTNGGSTLMGVQQDMV